MEIKIALSLDAKTIEVIENLTAALNKINFAPVGKLETKVLNFPVESPLTETTEEVVGQNILEIKKEKQNVKKTAKAKKVKSTFNDVRTAAINFMTTHAGKNSEEGRALLSAKLKGAFGLEKISELDESMFDEAVEVLNA